MRISGSLLVAIALAACAPVVDGPTERQRALDREDAGRLEGQLAALPGVVRAQVVLLRAVHDPLGGVATAPAATVVVAVDDQAPRAAIAGAATKLVAALAPGVAPAIVVEVAAVRPRLAKVGPFTVEESSYTRLKVALACLLALVIALAGWIAWRTRPVTRRGTAAPS